MSCERLAKQGWILRIAVRRPDQALFLKPLGDVAQIVPIAANIRHERSVAHAVQGADTVINLVGILHEGGRQRFDAVHVEGVRRLARAAAGAGVRRFLHVSALGADAGSRSSYARTKAEGEATLREHFPAAIILRPSVVFGPEDDFFNRFAAMARFSPVLPLIGGGKTRFQPIYVGDVADAAAAALNNPAFAGKLFEIGGPRAYSFRELMEMMLAVIGRRRLLLPVPFPIAAMQAAFLGLSAEAAADAGSAAPAAQRQCVERQAAGPGSTRDSPHRAGSDLARLSRALSLWRPYEEGGSQAGQPGAESPAQ